MVPGVIIERPTTARLSAVDTSTDGTPSSWNRASKDPSSLARRQADAARLPPALNPETAQPGAVEPEGRAFGLGPGDGVVALLVRDGVTTAGGDLVVDVEHGDAGRGGDEPAPEVVHAGMSHDEGAAVQVHEHGRGILRGRGPVELGGDRAATCRDVHRLRLLEAVPGMAQSLAVADRQRGAAAHQPGAGVGEGMHGAGSLPATARMGVGPSADGCMMERWRSPGSVTRRCS
ncbi:hypothetical protein GCM10009821_01920 [Aeromicrobium halocynthiae]|uniref:Uncharacterized protein n=1 Tax=Aeromicrobium halocynthiae TaxID=560557 RepID=A0ABN2VQ56_9ACTN